MHKHPPDKPRKRFAGMIQGLTLENNLKPNLDYKPERQRYQRLPSLIGLLQSNKGVKSGFFCIQTSHLSECEFTLSDVPLVL